MRWLRGGYIQQTRGLFKVYNGPVRNSYVVNKTYLQLVWNNYIPYQLKYLSLFGTGILTLIKVHPSILLTLGPPMGLGAYYLKRNLTKLFRQRQIGQIQSSKVDVQMGTLDKPISASEIVKILPYDESQLYNVERGIENEYDSLREQIVDLVEQRIVEYISLNPDSTTREPMRDFISNESQFNINVFSNQVETWTSTLIHPNRQVEPTDNVSDLKLFINLSVPYYSSRNVNTRKRLGVISVFLMKLNETDWKMVLNIAPLGWRSRDFWIRDINGCEYLASRMFATLSSRAR
ncbi:hypothetical protein KGF56_000679 [Candida oxycetoniae]|uniref:Uncharacterized protein n=1 Tax=Candida oxycetoniae TaxID=497107 RepID=A0AAI9WZN2_9ASCO|nr:uncharacterized protein KGF56_000679 [Candida oxycetoniae]KAI3406547.2 hypothetical protein KGF56_000679 [Candida oxycetoniae]